MSRQYQRTKYNPTQYHSTSTNPSNEEDLSECRIITKNLVYVIGLSNSVASKDKLCKYEYLGQYGTIQKIVVNRNKAYNQTNTNGPTFSAYVTYAKPCEASIAILSLDDTIIDNHPVRASFGTTKYCAYFLKGVECINRDCVYLHKWADEADIIHRRDLVTKKYVFNKQHEYAIKIADIYNPSVKRKLMTVKKGKTVFPAVNMIYRNIFVIENDPDYKKNNTQKKAVENKSSLSSSKSNANIINSPTPVITSLSGLFGDDIKIAKPKVNPSLNLVKPSHSTEHKEEKKAADLNDLLKVKDKKSFFTDSTTSSTSKEDYQNKECSRFDFVNINTEENYEPIPNEIQSYVQKKLSLFGINKYMNSRYIDKYLKEEYLNNKDKSKENKLLEWINYTSTYKSTNRKINTEDKEEDEYTQDFNDINDFILLSCDSDSSGGKSKTNSL
ncbi:MAG: hypothetical protein MJ252_28925 [archaeon]|nr:hypothetical protein [archaeon]